MSKLSYPKNRIHGKTDPAFDVIYPTEEPTQIYGVTMYVKAHQLGQSNFYGSGINVFKLSQEEYDEFSDQTEGQVGPSNVS